MRHLTTCLAPFLLLACGGSESAPDADGAGGAGGTGGSPNTTSGVPTTTVGGGGTGGTPIDPTELPKEDNFDEDSTPDDDLSMAVTAAAQLTPDQGSLAGITADDRVVYSTSDGLFTIKAALGAPPRKAASIAGDVYVRGRTVFNFANIDYTAGEGALTFWTPEKGRRFAGTALIGEARVATRHDDAHILFMNNQTEDTVDIVVSSADAEKAYVLLEGIGRGDMDTCGPTIGFAGDAAIVTWCEVGSTDATLSRFTTNTAGAWVKQDITTAAQGMWSSDGAGQKLFYVSSDAEGIVRDMSGEGETKVGEGVGWGMLTKSGDALFFTVGDQLRRSDMIGSAIPIVVEGFEQTVAWSSDYSKALYSTTVIYEDSTKQDLRSSPTEWFNPTPSILVSEPIATLGRSPMTDDANFALYLTEVGTQGGVLHIQPLDGGAETTLDGIDSVVAASGSMILVTDNRTAPGVYPALVDLKLYDADMGDVPALLEEGILEGRDIRVRSDKNVVAYRRDGDVAEGGIWLRPM